MAIAFAVASASLGAAGRNAVAGASALYSIDFHAISSGGSSLRNPCFAVSGTVGQAAPGYSSTTSGAPTYSVYAGFWAAAPAATGDEIFFTGFEDC